MKLSDFKDGREVMVSFTKAGDKMDGNLYQACDLTTRHHYWRR